MQPHYRIRAMRAREVGIAVDWAAREGWNPGLHDAACFASADPGGFLIGELDGAPVAVISAVQYGADGDGGDRGGDGGGDNGGDGGDNNGFGFIGLYIVAPAMRGRGFGLQIWQAAMARLRGRNIGLDGVLAQQDNYRQSGFSLAHRNVRYQGVGGPGVDSADAGDIEVVELPAAAFADIAAFDRRFFPAERAAFLRAWLAQPDGAALGVRARGDGELAGYGVLRKCRAGHKIGPLFAESPQVAQALFDALAARAAAGAPLYLDIPAPNPHARALVQSRGMQAVFETARMYTGAPPALPLENIFGITTFELG